jgi:hypothetical protein
MDEMDLVRQSLEVTPLRPEAYGRARTMLGTAMAESGPPPHAAPPPEVAPLRNRRRRSLSPWGKAGLGAGIAAVAAAAAVLVATSVPQHATPAPRHAAAAGSASGTPAVQSKLMSLAAHIQATSGSLPGNASLIIRTQVEGTIPAQVSYNLYTDNGAYYAGGNKQSLMQAVAQHQNMADGGDAREVAAARYAVTGNLATAREQMNNALHNNDYYLPLAQRQQIWAQGAAARAALEKAKGIKTPLKMPAGQALQEDIDNSIWNNSMDALSAGAGNPQVREGVLRLLSTIPEVTVANSTTGGVATLTLTAGSALFEGSAEQVLTINAQTGMPIKSVFPAEGNVPSSVQTFQVSRVTMADIESGKF